MRRIAVGAVLVLCALVKPATGQVEPPAPPFALNSWIDSPSPLVVTDYTLDFHVSGWAFDCRTGQLPPFVAVLDHDYTTQQVTWLTSYLVFRELPRPDVQAQFAGMCPNVSSATGYAVYPRADLPPGLHTLAIFWNTGDGLSRSQNVTVNVPAPQ